MINTLSRTGPALDEVHSFVLRVSISHGRGGGGALRPQFLLEHVNSRTTNRTNSLREACVLLESQVNTILEEFGENC